MRWISGRTIRWRWLVSAAVAVVVLGLVLSAALASSERENLPPPTKGQQFAGEADFRAGVRAALAASGGPGLCALIQGRSAREIVDTFASEADLSDAMRFRAGEIIQQECHRIND